ncbi:envelope protein [Common moorhen coronavirus HKU21]|uniref:Envelope protein n=1 Tax=Common moorhen coronavirus HKU21 TaxID=1159902 RepID=H9BR36_9NIDO|nr:envelope protein [Common moorhen coronavirus HKU21]AFD29245.1 envelope protein [Common moorhen coronavirus HKU21]
MVDNWDITIPGDYVIAALVVICVAVFLLFINTCLACIKLVYKCYKGATVLLNPFIIFSSKVDPESSEDFVKIHQFPRNSFSV